MTIQSILLILAFIAFVLATIGVPARIDLKALGLSLWVLSLLIRVVVIAACLVMFSGCAAAVPYLNAGAAAWQSYEKSRVAEPTANDTQP